MLRFLSNFDVDFKKIVKGFTRLPAKSNIVEKIEKGWSEQYGNAIQTNYRSS